METAFLIVAVAGSGLLIAVAAIIWQVKIKPRLRRRYEKRHFMNKVRK